MKRCVGLSLVIVSTLLVVNYAFAVSVGNNVGTPHIFVFFEDGLSSYDDWDSGSPGMEVLNWEEQWADEGAGPSGLHSGTYSTRMKVLKNSGSLSFLTNWMSLTTNDLYDPTTGELNCWAGPPFGTAPCVVPERFSDGGWFGGGGIADYSGAKYLVIGVGFKATSDDLINGTTNHHEFLVWVIDTSDGSLVQNFRFVDNVKDGEFLHEECEVKDYNGDGNDDLIIMRAKDHPTKADKSTKTVLVLDLLIKTKVTKFSYGVFKE